MPAITTFQQRRLVLRMLAATGGGLALHGCGGGADEVVLADSHAQPLQGRPGNASLASIDRFTRYRLTVIASAGTVGALNESGAVAGNTGDSHAFLYRNGEVKDLGTLGGERSSGTGINDSGQVSGTTELPDDGSLRAPIRAFIYSNGVMTDLGVLEGGRGSQGTRINNHGQVTGGATPPMSGFHAFLYSNGEMRDLGDLGGGVSIGYDINDKGQIAGQATVSAPDGPSHAFLYSDGEMRDLGTLDGSFDNTSVGNAINASGQVTGSSTAISVDMHAFLYSDGRMEDLGSLLQGGLSIGRGINTQGWVVGFTDGPTGPVAFVHDGGAMHDLNALVDASGEGWIVYHAYDVNDAGAIAAIALRGGYGGALAPVLLTQVPC